MKPPRALLLCACAAIGLGQRAAFADGSGAVPEQVYYHRSGCSPLPFDEAALASRLRVELAEGGVRVLDAAEPNLDAVAAPAHETTVAILEGCSAAKLTISIEDETGFRTRRSVDLRATAPALRERALAIAIAELLRARWAERAAGAAEPAGAPDAGPPQSAKMPSEGARSVPRAAPEAADGMLASKIPPARSNPPALLSLGIEWRFLLEQDTALTGGRLGASLAAGSSWLVRFSAEAGAFYDTEKDAARAVELLLVTGRLGLSAGYGWASAEIGAGPRLELGWARRRVMPRVPGALAQGDGEAIAIASVVGTGRVRLTPRTWLSLDLELSQVLKGLDAPRLPRSSLGIDGTAAGGRVGIALEL